jgi:hypothetical protein
VEEIRFPIENKKPVTSNLSKLLTNFSPDVSMDGHNDIVEILLKVAFYTNNNIPK